MVRLSCSRLLPSRERWCVFFLAFLLALAALYRGGYTLSMEIISRQGAVLQVFWAESESGYDRDNVASVRLRAEARKYVINFGGLSPLSFLRIDPLDRAGSVCFKRLVLEHPLYGLQIFQSEEQFSAWRMQNDIRSARMTGDGFCIETVGAGQGQSAAAVPDPYFDFSVTMPVKEHAVAWWLARWIGSAFLLSCVVFLAIGLLTGVTERVLAGPGAMAGRVLPLAFFLPLVGIAVMAATSLPNIHPDEKVHVDAGVYYTDHWLPPAIGDPAIDHTYSAYGMSRLDSLSSTYLAAGRVMALLQRLASLDNYTAARLFALSLLVLLALLTWKMSWQRSVVWVALVTPQVWYMFSYLNDDLLPFFYSLVLSGICRRWTVRPMDITWKTACLAGLLVGLLALEKANYLVFILYLVLYCGWMLWTKERRVIGSGLDPTRLRLVGVVLLAACVVYGARLGVDRMVNGPDRNEKRLAYAEQRAKDGFKPSQYGDKDSYYGIHLKDKGLKFSEIFSKWKWHVITARSFFGLYGPMSIQSPGWYYTTVYCLSAGLFLYLLIMGITGGWRTFFPALATLGAVAGLVAVSAWHSWTVDFQAQGRYLFPLLGVVSLYAGLVWQRLYPPLVMAAVGLLYGLSLFSFYFYGVAGLLAR